MEEKKCRYCTEKFRPSRYHPDQQVCSSGDCQRRRRTAYHRKKLVEDPLYREQCRDSQKKWRENNPYYMKRYWAKRRSDDRVSAKRSNLTRELRQLLKMVKNNVAVDLRALDASIWLVSPNGLLSEKNSLGSAKIIIMLGASHSSG
jgi:sensor c-di-GMP phosphodiesterase-like protein